MPTPRRRRKLMGEINVVPYIDVMLVLLIIFMITAPLLTQGVQVELPEANAKPIDPELLKNREPLVLSVDRDGRYYLNIGGDEDSPIGEAEVARVSQTHDLPAPAVDLEIVDGEVVEWPEAAQPGGGAE